MFLKHAILYRLCTNKWQQLTSKFDLYQMVKKTHDKFWWSIFIMLWQSLSVIYSTYPIQDSCNTIYSLTYTSIHILFISLFYHILPGMQIWWYPQCFLERRPETVRWHTPWSLLCLIHSDKRKHDALKTKSLHAWNNSLVIYKQYQTRFIKQL